MSELILIAAMDSAGGIGLNGKMPWHIPGELAFFKRTTEGYPIIMGRKTFESIGGKPLPGRRNLVVSSAGCFAPTGVETFESPLHALYEVKNEKAFVIGGARIYEALLPVADTLILTRIAKFYGCDTFFPAFDPFKWDYAGQEDNTPGSLPITYTATYRRIAA